MYGYLVHVLVAFELFIFLAAFAYTSLDTILFIGSKMTGQPKVTPGECFYRLCKLCFIDAYKVLVS
jgi:hypothetical protein